MAQREEEGRETQRERHRERDTERERQTGRDRQRETGRQRQTDRQALSQPQLKETSSCSHHPPQVWTRGSCPVNRRIPKCLVRY